MDNNSSDNSYDVLSEWKEHNESEDFRIDLYQETIPGACAARNLALKHIDSEWTMFFDSDDTMPKDHVKRALKESQIHPDAQIIGWARRIHLKNGKVLIKKFRTRNPEYENLTQSICATQNYMAKTSLFNEAGGWDNRIKVGQDIEIGSRLLKLKPNLLLIKNHFIDVYETPLSITNSTKNGMREMKYTLDKIRGTFPKDKNHWIDLQLIIKAASWGKDDPDSPEIVKEILNKTSPRRRWLWRLFYLYQLNGGRGVARIYSLLHFNRMHL